LAQAPEWFGPLKTEHHCTICTARLLHKVGLWNRNPNFGLRFQTTKIAWTPAPQLCQLTKIVFQKLIIIQGTNISNETPHEKRTEDVKTLTSFKALRALPKNSKSPLQFFRELVTRTTQSYSGFPKLETASTGHGALDVMMKSKTVLTRAIPVVFNLFYISFLAEY